MASFNQKYNFPSGVKLPFILRKKFEQQQALASGATPTAAAIASTNNESSDLAVEKELQPQVFTAQELENKIWKASAALVEVQKQIFRGEEAYYEETFGHGNLVRGWEGFLDAKDVGTTSNSKPPKDTRWFSGSSSISRTARPPPINTQWTRPLVRTTPTPTPLSSTTSAAQVPPNKPPPARAARRPAYARRRQLSSTPG